MSELLVTFTVPTRSASGEFYYPRAFGRVADDGLWEGWIEFTRAGDDEVIRTARETEQPNRSDLTYWAQGLSETYLEGALGRALRPPVRIPVVQPDVRRFSKSVPRSAPRRTRVVLDPYAAYAEGEEILRAQLRALRREHLLSIAEAYQFTTDDDAIWARSAPEAALVERIVDRVRERFVTTESETAPAAEGDQQSATAEDRPS